MADIPKVVLSERLLSPDTYKKYLGYVLITALICLTALGCISLYKFFFPDKKNVNKPEFHISDGGTVTYTNVQNDEKSWEVGLGAGALQYDNKTGAFAGGWVKRKW